MNDTFAALEASVRKEERGDPRRCKLIMLAAAGDLLAAVARMRSMVEQNAKKQQAAVSAAIGDCVIAACRNCHANGIQFTAALKHALVEGGHRGDALQLVQKLIARHEDTIDYLGITATVALAVCVDFTGAVSCRMREV